MRDQCIKDHVSHAGIERNYFIDACRWGKDGQVRDSPHVQQSDARALLSVKQVFGVGNQGSSLSSGGKVASTKITDHRTGKMLTEKAALPKL
ncbi:hypothetical protein SDC9_186569 [bioreactor metagenome]|uniref:Uncharacterized protein n=1 Tax=bioreactor metagenome TaxID=1076179 RepID=A0A645HUJ1_9ZZZZ